MKKLISPNVMRECEQNWFQQTGTPSIRVMEKAAEQLAAAVREKLPKGAVVYIACGTGGNGGDGAACARLLMDTYDVHIVQIAEPRHPDAVIDLDRARELGIPISNRSPEVRPDGWIDALFGTGLSRKPEDAWAELIGRINEDHILGSYTLAADIPSGLNGSTGRAYEPCVNADCTVTFQIAKTGLWLQDGADHCGEIRTADVGFDEEAFQPLDAWLIEKEDLSRLLPARKRNIHKGSCGHLLIVAGSFGMTGAAALAALGALRSGVGLISIACPRSIVPMLQTLVPQAMCIPLEEQNGAIAKDACGRLEQALNGKTAVAMGCGLSRNASFEIVRTVLDSGLPCVVDADALNLIADRPELSSLLQPWHVLTPHPGEAARLPESPAANAAPLGRALTEDPISCARKLASLGATVLLKGASSVIASPGETLISASGCCGMARGGSGDILTGILGALLAEPSDRSPALSAAVASELHGLAGEMAQAKYGQRAMNSRDILEFLPCVFPQ